MNRSSGNLLILALACGMIAVSSYFHMQKYKERQENNRREWIRLKEESSRKPQKPQADKNEWDIIEEEARTQKIKTLENNLDTDSWEYVAEYAKKESERRNEILEESRKQIASESEVLDEEETINDFSSRKIKKMFSEG